MGREIERFYKSGQVCKATGVTPRMLGYWVTKGYVIPSKVWISKNRARSTFLFSFRDIVRIKLMRAFRDAGLPLRRIHSAINRLAGMGIEKEWQAVRLVTDGTKLYRVYRDDSNRRLDAFSLSDGEYGQMVFADIAIRYDLGQMREHIRSEKLRPARKAEDSEIVELSWGEYRRSEWWA